MLKIVHLLLLLLFLFIEFSCKKLVNTTNTNERMILVYMAANNNLRDNALDCINKLEAGIQDNNNNLIVFIKTNSSNSYLIKIKKDYSSKIVSDTVKIYEDINSSIPNFMQQVIHDSRKLYPSKSYGLILWSHASSWYPSTNYLTKSFGDDRGYDVDILELKNILPKDFYFIIFDACSMASIETIYELKDNAKYIIASPTEVLSTSYPYEAIVPYFYGNVPELKMICKKFIDYYHNLEGAFSSATVSLINTSYLAELAQNTKILLDKVPNKQIVSDNVQRLDFSVTTKVEAYDFSDLFLKNFSEEEYSKILKSLNNVIEFKGNTNFFLNNPIKTFCGLSCYIPKKNDSYEFYYKLLNWSSQSGYNNLF